MSLQIFTQVAAECVELKGQLEQQIQLAESMRTQRDVALSSLHKHGIASDDFDAKVADFQTLQASNEELRAVIKQMRVEIEQLSDLSDHRNGENMPTANYVRYMEEEVRKVKSENRQLVAQLQQMKKPPTPKRKGSSPAQEDGKRSSQVRSRSPVEGEGGSSQSGAGDVHLQHRGHLIALSDTIASLQREKADLENTVRHWKEKADKLQEKLNEEQELVSPNACSAYYVFCSPQERPQLHSPMVARGVLL